MHAEIYVEIHFKLDAQMHSRMHASLTDQEKEYFDKVLSELKMNYVEVEKTEDAKPEDVEDTTRAEDSDDSSSEE